MPTGPARPAATFPRRRDLADARSRMHQQGTGIISQIMDGAKTEGLVQQFYFSTYLPISGATRWGSGRFSSAIGRGDRRRAELLRAAGRAGLADTCKNCK